jgi:hypothetical protein
LDGKEVVGKTPVTLSSLEMDRPYTLQIELAGYETLEKVIKKSLGDAKIENFVLVRNDVKKKPLNIVLPQLGGEILTHVSVRTEPWCEVFVNGQSAGVTPLSGTSSLALPKGKYKIKLETNPKIFKYPAKEFHLTVTQSQNLICSYSFKKPKSLKCK